MSIWSTLLGGAAGFAMGGPLGALVGAVAGHVIDRPSDEEPVKDATKKVSFTIGVIVLGAKMAKADGAVTRDEIAAFREVFHVPPHEVKNVARVFDRAKKEVTGFEPYARQLGKLFKDNPAVLEDLLDALFHIAKADGSLHPAELAYLEAVASIFGFDQAAFERIQAGHTTGSDSDPYLVLGMSRDASDEALKTRYRQLVRENHPDTLMAQGLPQEFIDLANEKVAAINDAYDSIQKHRGQT
ncbi:MAG: TerB family tellurite resistance protein [Alphaproteobacteria bacterium]